MISNNLHIKNDTLFFAGKSTKDLAEKYGSPIYVMDEQKIRENCRKYVNGMKKYFGENAKPFYIVHNGGQEVKIKREATRAELLPYIVAIQTAYEYYNQFN